VIVEIITFSPRDEGYIDLEPRIYEAMCQRRGFMRRTTSRNDDEWCVVQLWDSFADAEAGWDESFAAAVNVVSVKRYEDLGG
jgi:hypothetical protein